MDEGLSSDAGARIWEQLEAFCARSLGDFGYVAVVFDGAGGEVIGAEAIEQ